MAKKSKARVRTVRPRQQPPPEVVNNPGILRYLGLQSFSPWKRRPQTALAQQRWRRKLVLGGVIVALVLGIGAGMRFWLQLDLALRLQRALGITAVDHHYTRGVVGAPVVIKEFSDYT